MEAVENLKGLLKCLRRKSGLMQRWLEESEATSTRAAKKLSEKQKIFQEQGNLIKEKVK